MGLQIWVHGIHQILQGGEVAELQPFDIQGQTYQIPLTLDRVQATPPELAKAQDPLDPTDGCFHQPFALGLRLLTLGRVQFALHAPGGCPPRTPPWLGAPLPSQRRTSVNASGFQLLQVPFIAVTGIGQQTVMGVAVVRLHGI